MRITGCYERKSVPGSVKVEPGTKDGMGNLEPGEGCFENWDIWGIREEEREDRDASATRHGSAPAILGATSWSNLGLGRF